MIHSRCLVLVLACLLSTGATAQVLTSKGQLQVSTIRDVPGSYATIQAAIEASVAGDRVVVAPGTYFENIDFLGKAITVASTDGPGLTAIDGGGSGAVVTFDSGEGLQSVLEGFVLTHGDAGAGEGGGVRCILSGPTIRDCWLRFNFANDGAGVYLRDAPLTVIEDCEFENNAATRFGGGLDSVRSVVTLTGCTVRDNTAAFDGGGLGALGGTVTLDRCAFIQNVAGGQGGAVSFNGTDGVVRSCSVVMNRAQFGGGLSFDGSAAAAVVGCMVGANAATVSGGGIDVLNCSPTISSTTLAENTAASGAGIGGSNAGSPITNCIVWGNQPDAMAFAGTSAPTVSFSDVEGGYPGVGNIDADPEFANQTGGNYRIGPTSACIDSGTNAAAGLLGRDFDRQPRIRGAAIDLGADEHWSPAGSFHARYAMSDCRLLCYNVWDNSIFPAVNPAQAAKFARVLTALDPDVICFQELKWSEGQIVQLLDGISPLAGGGSWSVHRASINTVIAARYSLSLEATATVPAGQRPLAMALVDLPDALFDSDLYVINTHFKCCGDEGNDPLRQQQADAIVSWMRDARSPGGAITLPADTGIVVAGDLNMIASFQPVATLLNGDVLDELQYGPDAPPDWDGGGNVDLQARHNGRESFDYTWRNDNSLFAPGRLDYVTYSDSSLRRANAFVLNTMRMAPAELAAAGLQAEDVARDGSQGDYDHLPIVVDWRATKGPIHARSDACGELYSGWSGDASIGSTITFTVHGARPFERVTFLSGALAEQHFESLGLGTPGCSVAVASALPVRVRADASGTCSYSFPVPSDVQLIGTKLFVQWSAGGPSNRRTSGVVEVTYQP